MRKSLILIAMLGIYAAVCPGGQEPIRDGLIQGTIKNIDGLCQWGARVSISGRSGPKYQTKTYPGGHFSLKVCVSDSPYTIQVECNHYNSVVRSGLQPTVGVPFTIDIQLGKGSCPLYVGPLKGYDVSRGPFRVGGAIYDEEGHLLRDAVVEVMTRSGSQSIEGVTTKGDGRYEFTNIMMDQRLYYLRASAAGRTVVIQTLEHLGIHSEAWFNFTLRHPGEGAYKNFSPIMTRAEAKQTLETKPNISRVFYVPVGEAEEGCLDISLCDASFILQKASLQLTNKELPGTLVITADGTQAVHVQDLPLLPDYDLAIKANSGGIVVSGVDVLPGEHPLVDVLTR